MEAALESLYWLGFVASLDGSLEEPGGSVGPLAGLLDPRKSARPAIFNRKQPGRGAAGDALTRQANPMESLKALHDIISHLISPHRRQSSKRLIQRLVADIWAVRLELRYVFYVGFL